MSPTHPTDSSHTEQHSRCTSLRNEHRFMIRSTVCIPASQWGRKNTQVPLWHSVRSGEATVDSQPSTWASSKCCPPEAVTSTIIQLSHCLSAYEHVITSFTDCWWMTLQLAITPPDSHGLLVTKGLLVWIQLPIQHLYHASGKKKKKRLHKSLSRSFSRSPSVF